MLQLLLGAAIAGSGFVGVYWPASVDSFFSVLGLLTAVLGALLYRALVREAIALAAGITYAATDELHQHFVQGRHASPADVAIDAVGVALGMLVWLRVRER